MVGSRKILVCVSLFIFLVDIFILPFPGVVFARQSEEYSQQAINRHLIIDQLTPEQKIGQLFLVTFEGNEIKSDSRIVDLISKHFIGGVVLKRDNDNFIGPEKTLETAVQLITSLQETAAGLLPAEKPDKIQPTVTPAMPVTNQSFIPLFIGISQEGDSYPFNQILSGLSPLPNLMAIGATWDTGEAEKVGVVLGDELQRLGFNLLLGPSLDVLDVNYTSGADDLGTRTFGGDPFWVSQMGKAYIRGIHQGSENQLAVIAKHFPGRGGSDRLPETEVATVRKSLDQLRLIELSPFFAVTGNAVKPEEQVEGLLLSHIRYQGLQGNIRAFTKPVSLDPSALGILMNLPEFSEWRKTGGIIVSDDLGSKAVRNSFDPTGKNFDARQAALSAFLAGNDLLYMDRIISTNDQDTYTTILRILDFFVQKYREDRAFAERVDASVDRILKLKSGIYKSFDIEFVRPQLKSIEGIGKSVSVSFGAAAKSITLLNPEKKDLTSTIPQPPSTRSNMVFFTDDLEYTQCSQCKKQSLLSVDEFRNTVIKLYGPGAGGLVNPSRLSSYSLNDLNTYLDSPLNNLDLDSNISKADWLIFALRTPDPSRPASNALHRLISEKPQLVRDKKVIAFAFNTPYRLDATDISNLTAYYGVYSKLNSFVEIAVRILFQEIHPQGASPVSVPGIAYDINFVTSPDPQKPIKLTIDLNESQQSGTQGQPTPVPAFYIGDSIPLKAGVILDHNGHLVPDGTVVKFLFNLTGEKRVTQQIESVTRDGIARINFRIQDPGMLEIKVNSDPAYNSEILLLDITPGKSIIVSAVTPTILPTSPSSPADELDNLSQPQKWVMTINQTEWLVVFSFLWLLAGLMLLIGNRFSTIAWGIRAGLSAVIGGFFAYLWLILGFFGNFLLNNRSMLFTIIVVLIGAAVGLIVNWFGFKKTFDNLNEK